MYPQIPMPLGFDLTARVWLWKLAQRHALPMLMRVHRLSGGHTSLIIIETGDALSMRIPGGTSGGKGHDQYKRFHGQCQKSLKRGDDSSAKHRMLD